MIFGNFGRPINLLDIIFAAVFTRNKVDVSDFTSVACTCGFFE